MNTDRTEKIRHIRTFGDRLTLLVDPIPNDQRTAVLIPGEWTIAQIVHHLGESHMHAYLRCKRMLIEDNPTLQPYGQEDWANHPPAMDPHLVPSLTLLRGLHHRWADLFAALTEDQWQRTGQHPEYDQPVTLAGFLNTYVDHCHNHVDQINRLLTAGNFKTGGAFVPTRR